MTEQFGLLNKSFRDIKKDFANGLGFKNSLFQTSISKTDYQALQKFNSAIKVTNDGLTMSQRITKAWNENMSGCSIAAKRMGNDLVTGKKNIQDISKAMNTASGSTKALGVAMNVVANVGFMLAITAITKVIFELTQAQDNAAQAAKEATETYKSELDSIADYKQRLSELHEELKSGNLSYEVTKAKRTELMTIQDELIEKFGTEEDAIKSVTDAVKGQVDALNDLNEKAYRDWVAKADHESIWTQLLPWGKSGLDQAIDYMETEKTVSFMDMQNANLSDELQAIQKEIDETIRAKYNLDKTFAMFNVTGTPDELRTQLENIRQDYIDISKKIFAEKNIPDHGMWKEYQKETVDSINEAITSLDKGLDEHQDTYKTYIEGLIKYDSEYSDEYANILQKRAELESAQNSGNAEEVNRAKQEFMDSINDAIIASDSDENIKKYFESLYPELQAEFNNWIFEFDLKANVKGLEDTAKEIGEKYTATDLFNMVNTEGVQEGEETFNSLIDKAIEYGVCTDKSAEEVQKLINLLVELGIVQDNVKGDTFNDKNPISSLSISDTVTQLNTRLKPASDSLKSAYNDIFTDDGFTLNSIDILSTCDAIKSKLDEMSDPEGLNLDVDYSAFEDFVRVLNNTESTEYDVEKAFDSLATSITHAALTGKEDFDTMKAVLEDLGVTNNEIVAFDALASNTEALKEAGLDLANATEEQVTAFAEAMVSAENYGQAINLLRIQKILCKESPLSTAEDINELYRLAQAAGISANAIQQLMGLNSAYVIAAESGNTIAMTAVKVQMDMARKQVLDQFAGLRTDVDFSEIGGGVSKAKSAGEAAGKSYADALKDELSNLNSAISYIGGVIGDQIDLFQEQKDAAVDALEAEKEAAEEALEAEKELVQEKIDAKQAEIDAIEDAAKARKNELDLQKAQYDLERVQNQKTMLAYSESKGMHYVADTKEIRQAKEAATEAKENIQVANMEKDIAGLNDTIEGLDKKIGESNEYYGKLIEETGKYWDSLIKGLEEYKSRWQELADIEEQAKMEAMLRNLGITTEDILSMSGSAFGSFKDTYLGLLSEMYAGNGEMSKMLQEFGGISTGTLGPLPGALDAVAGSLGRLSASAGDAGANTSTVSGNMGALSTSAAGLNDNLPGVASTLNDILENNKLETAAGQLGELAGAIQSVSDALGGMPTGMDISGVAGQFDALGSSVGRASASISGGDAPKAGPPGGAPGNNATNAQGGAYSLVGSIKGLKSEADKSVGTNENSGIIGQFNRLGASVARVSAAVGGRAAEPGGNAGDGGKGPGSLISSVTALGPAAGETLGEPGGEGVAGRFGQLATTIAGAEGHVAGIISKLDELGKMPPAECTIVVNVETRGGLPGGTPANPVSDAIGALGKAGGQHTTKHKGKAYAQGTALVAGDWEAQSAGGKALVGEAGYEIVVRGGRFFTVGDRGPEMFPIQKGDIVFNHRQSVELLERGHTTGRGKAYADGTVGGGKSLTPDGAILEPYDPATDATAFGKLYAAWQQHYGSMEDKVGEIQKALSQHLTVEHSQQMQNDMNRLSIVNHNNRNIHSNATFGDVNIICPGVTEQQIAEKLPGVLNNAFRGFSVSVKSLALDN